MHCPEHVSCITTPQAWALKCNLNLEQQQFQLRLPCSGFLAAGVPNDLPVESSWYTILFKSCLTSESASMAAMHDAIEHPIGTSRVKVCHLMTLSVEALPLCRGPEPLQHYHCQEEKQSAGRHGFWEALDRPMASRPLNGVQSLGGGWGGGEGGVTVVTAAACEALKLWTYPSYAMIAVAFYRRSGAKLTSLLPHCRCNTSEGCASLRLYKCLSFQLHDCWAMLATYTGPNRLLVYTVKPRQCQHQYPGKLRALSST